MRRTPAQRRAGSASSPVHLRAEARVTGADLWLERERADIDETGRRRPLLAERVIDGGQRRDPGEHERRVRGDREDLALGVARIARVDGRCALVDALLEVVADLVRLEAEEDPAAGERSGEDVRDDRV